MEVHEPGLTYGKQKISIQEYLEMENGAMKSMNITRAKYSPCQGLKCHIILLQQIFLQHFIIN